MFQPVMIQLLVVLAEAAAIPMVAAAALAASVTATATVSRMMCLLTGLAVDTPLVFMTTPY
jgi:hypothetical protein